MVEIKIKRSPSPSSGRTIDHGQFRKPFTVPFNALSFATVGHLDPLIPNAPEGTPAFARIEDGQVWVECTLQPDGDQIIARVGVGGAGEDWGISMPLDFGCRVLIGWPDNESDSPVILERLQDANCTRPTSVAGIATDTGVEGGPVTQVAFVKLPGGKILAIETGAEGVVQVGGTGLQVTATQMLMNGAVHLGGTFTTPPVPATVGPAGTEIPAVPALPFIPIPGVTLTIPPYLGPEDGIVRAKDKAQSNVVIDPVYWAWLAAADVILKVFGLVAPTPIKMDSQHSSASTKHTAGD